jgi:hypothetical protein
MAQKGIRLGRQTSSLLKGQAMSDKTTQKAVVSAIAPIMQNAKNELAEKGIPNPTSEQLFEAMKKAMLEKFGSK